MAFSLDALSSSAQKAWRLKTNGQWQPCAFAQDICIDDHLVCQKSELQQWQGKRLKHKNNRMIVSQKSGFFDFLMRGVFIYPVLHRFSAPTLPSKEDLTACIHAAIAGKSQLLYLNIAGQFRVFEIYNNPIIGNPDIAVRGEIVSSSDYLGSAVSSENIESLYLQFISAWLEHLQCKRLGIFVPELRKTKSEQEMITDILNWQPQPNL